jgi:hypothetical protein
MSSALPTSTSRRRSAIIVAIAVAATVSLAAAVFVPLAAHADTGLITGKVTLPTGKAASGVTVQAVRTFDGVVEATAKTATSGSFSIANVTSPEEYTLKFAATSTTFEQYLGATSDFDYAQRINVADGATSTVAVSLQASGTLSGTVKTSSGKAVSSATVTVYQGSGSS